MSEMMDVPGLNFESCLPGAEREYITALCFAW
jgi:hypothetical protein